MSDEQTVTIDGTEHKVSDLVMPLIKAVQELSARVKTLEG